MTKSGAHIARASESDIAGIVALLAENHNLSVVAHYLPIRRILK